LGGPLGQQCSCQHTRDDDGCQQGPLDQADFTPDCIYFLKQLVLPIFKFVSRYRRRDVRFASALFLYMLRRVYCELPRAS
jgi:hypothetical protein